jgi:hypothetical protein
MRRPRCARRLWTGFAVLCVGVLAAALAVLGTGAAPAAAAAAPAAPGFSGKTLTGAPVSLKAYHGKPLVLLFWGSW